MTQKLEFMQDEKRNCSTQETSLSTRKTDLAIIQTWWKTNLGFGKEVIVQWISNMQKVVFGDDLFYKLFMGHDVGARTLVCNPFTEYNSRTIFSVSW